jgi:hypothetical protein
VVHFWFAQWEGGGERVSLFTPMLGMCHNIFETIAGAGLLPKCVAISAARCLDQVTHLIRSLLLKETADLRRRADLCSPLNIWQPG